MRALHRRAALAVAAGLVFVSACEPLDRLFGASDPDETSDEVAAAEDPDAANGVEQGPPAPEVEESEEEPVEAAPGRTEDPSPEAPREGGVDDQAGEGPAGRAAAPCTGDDTMLSADLPAEAEHVQTATGDLTGDGQPDELITYALDLGDSPIFTLRIVAASGYIVERELEAAVDLYPVMPLGAAALGGDREVAFVLEGSGASGFGVSLFALHDWDDDPCALLPVTIPDHTAPRMFPIGGTVGQSSGLGCAEVGGVPALTVTSAQQSSDGGYDWTRFSYHWPDAGELQFAADEMAVIPEGDNIPGVGELTCAGMSLP